MLNAALLVLLAAVLIYPAYLLWRQADRFTWRARYLLAALPAAYTGLGWQVAAHGSPTYRTAARGSPMV